MNHTKKMKLVPMDGFGDSDVFVDEVPPQVEPEEEPQVAMKGNSIRKYAADRQKKLLHVVLKLAAYGGYDEYGRIKTRDGTFLESSDITPLLLHALSPGRNYRGMDEFIDLLHLAGVAPEYIINANVREKLRSRQKSQIKRDEFRTLPRVPITASRRIPRISSSTLPQHPMDVDMNSDSDVYIPTDDSVTIMKEKKRMRDEIEQYVAKKPKWDPQDSSDDDD